MQEASLHPAEHSPFTMTGSSHTLCQMLVVTLFKKLKKKVIWHNTGIFQPDVIFFWSPTSKPSTIQTFKGVTNNQLRTICGTTHTFVHLAQASAAKYRGKNMIPAPPLALSPKCFHRETCVHLFSLLHCYYSINIFVQRIFYFYQCSRVPGMPENIFLFSAQKSLILIP